MRAWKLIGLAGLAGVATATAAGVVIAHRRSREWDDVEPDELRSQLRRRLAAADEQAIR